MICFEPRQVIIINDLVYEVTGVFLGAVGQTNLIGLVPMSENRGSAYGEDVDECFVPEKILNAAIEGGAGLYQPVGEK